MVEIEFPEGNFLKIKETLTRIGIASRGRNTLTQTAHILHKRGRYYIVHFLEMMALDGKASHFDETDKARVEGIARLLEDWGLCTVIDDIGPGSLKNLAIVKFRDRHNWELVSKYTIGKFKA